MLLFIANPVTNPKDKDHIFLGVSLSSKLCTVCKFFFVEMCAFVYGSTSWCISYMWGTIHTNIPSAIRLGCLLDYVRSSLNLCQIDPCSMSILLLISASGYSCISYYFSKYFPINTSVYRNTRHPFAQLSHFYFPIIEMRWNTEVASHQSRPLRWARAVYCTVYQKTKHAW